MSASEQRVKTWGGTNVPATQEAKQQVTKTNKYRTRGQRFTTFDPSCTLGCVPGFRHVARVSRAVYLQHVAVADFWSAHGYKVGPQSSDGVLGHIGQRLTDARAEKKRPHHFVERSGVLVKVWIGIQAFGVDQVCLSWSDLDTKQHY